MRPSGGEGLTRKPGIVEVSVQVHLDLKQCVRQDIRVFRGPVTRAEGPGLSWILTQERPRSRRVNRGRI